ncbi:HupE/UreJ family protein [Methylomonas sp. 11b]|uniref:HupE/UreJ family protein n=1 Tax=Methylomonas sp. 11b TaxID=1168169 RepID=UPI00047B0020|nr:HupE/UreJ family protein [Methylomonas sp. 11b]
MNTKMFWPLLGLLCFVGIWPVAEAHTLGAEGTGLISGLAHPFVGVDHLLAMIAVGIWAGQLGGKAVWQVPLAFLGTMVLGSSLGLLGLSLPMVEPVIASSVLVLGLIIAGSVRLSMLAVTGTVGFFALFHGVAHGLELPHTASPILYGIGFVLATSLLHGLGIGLARDSSQYRIIQRLLGFTLIAASTMLLTP